MAAKHPAAKKATPDKPRSDPAKAKDPNVLQVQEGMEGITKEMSDSAIAARMSTRGYMAAHAMRAYSGFDSDLVSITDIDLELRANGDAVVSGDLGRVERMLTAQAITLDTIFANLAERSSRQEYMKNKDMYLRLALKAQAQCRATAEALALLKNPQPYIRQANLVQGGNQQVNNSYAGASPHTGIPASIPTLENEPSSTLPAEQMRARAGAGKLKTAQNKLLS